MNINTIAFVATQYPNTPASRTTQNVSRTQQESAAAQSPLDVDKVSISRTAQVAASAAAGVEIYQVPSWLAAHGKDLTVSLGEKAETIAARNSKFDRLTTAEQAEYGERIHGHYQALLQESGVGSAQDHYALFIQDKQSSEALRLQFETRIAGDDRLLQLMEKLNRKLA